MKKNIALFAMMGVSAFLWGMTGIAILGFSLSPKSHPTMGGYVMTAFPWIVLGGGGLIVRRMMSKQQFSAARYLVAFSLLLFVICSYGFPIVLDVQL